jgi:hypothetical protein
MGYDQPMGAHAQQASVTQKPLAELWWHMMQIAWIASVVWPEQLDGMLRRGIMESIILVRFRQKRNKGTWAN